MNFIKTKDGVVYKVENTYEHLGVMYYLVPNWTSSFAESDVKTHSDTLENLLDAVIVVPKDGSTPFTAQKCNFDNIVNLIENNDGYGAVWVLRKNKMPKLQAITKPLNESGNFELKEFFGYPE